MKTRSLLTSALLVSALAFGAVVLPSGGKPASARPGGPGGSVGIFLKLDGVQGDSTVKGFEKSIEIESLSFGVTHAAGAKPVPVEFTLTKELDASSAALYSRSALGELFRTAILTVVDPRDGQQAVYTLNNVVITSTKTSGSEVSDMKEVLTLSYTKLAIDVRVGAKGTGTTGTSTQGGYDFASHKQF